MTKRLVDNEMIVEGRRKLAQGDIGHSPIEILRQAVDYNAMELRKFLAVTS